jgi:UDP-N-acetylmuramate: L-alanyl-gamma-D-glutamyl-meso-diaminopimelate ligase
MDIADLKPGSWVHFVAIGGTGMGALAGLLQDQGQDQGLVVTGSDGPLYPPMSTFLEKRGIPVHNSFEAKNLEASNWNLPAGVGTTPALVIVGNAISRGHVEAARVEELLSGGKTQRMSFAQALAEFAIRDRESFVVAGTHGKTTTTSLLAWALESLGAQPGFFIGGIPKNFTSGCRMGEGAVFVSEGDEYDTAYWDKESKFLHYRPSWVLCTGVEFDHADIFSSLDQIVKSFEKLGTKTRRDWMLVDSHSAPLAEPVERLAASVRALGHKVYRYGQAEESEVRLISAEPDRLPWRSDVRGTRLRVKLPGLGEIELHSPMTGLHNALNLVGVLGVLVVSGKLKSQQEAQKFLQSFEGVKRRQEEVARDERTVVIDDFAHHPTAIRETVRAIRNRYPDAKLAAFFEARSATSARKVLEKEFAASFDEADAIFLTPPSKTNIPEDQKLDIQDLVRDISARPANQRKHLGLKTNAGELAQDFRSWRASEAANAKVVALVMSNGPFGGIHALLLG